MPVANFPYTSTDDAPRQGYSITPAWSTSVVMGQSEVEQRRKRVTYPRHKITGLKWGRDANTTTRLDTLYAFYQDCGGSYSPFAFFDFITRTWAKQYVGIGTGVQTVWNIPSYGGGTFTIYVNGSVVSSGYTISGGAGDNSRDRITFTSGAPTLGHIITATFTGRRVFISRFMRDEMSYESFSASLFDIGFDLIEVKGLEAA